MQNSLSNDEKWIQNWSQHMTRLALNKDLSSREVESFTNKLLEQASSAELGIVVKELLNHIRSHH